MAELELKYGNRTFSCRLDEARILSATVPPSPADPAVQVRAALKAPIGSPTLDKIVRPGEKVVIVTSDITRYTGSEIYLPVLIEQLNACGVPDDDIEILVALGIHRKQTENEHRKILGPLFGRIRVIDHDCDNPAELATIGATSDDLTITVNRRVIEADRVIVTGTVGFHYFAGFGGGRKGLVPGVAARETCMATHFRVLNPPEIGGRHPQAATGVLDGNPVHTAILAAARMVEPDFLLNTVLSPQKEILAVFAGEMEQAHLAACDLVRQLYAVDLAAPADLAVVSCGGQPKDINFIQAHKALDYGVGALRDGRRHHPARRLSRRLRQRHLLRLVSPSQPGRLRVGPARALRDQRPDRLLDPDESKALPGDPGQRAGRGGNPADGHGESHRSRRSTANGL